MPEIEEKDIHENILLLLMRRSGGTVIILQEEWDGHNGIWEDYTWSMTKGLDGFLLELVKRPR